MSKTTHTQLPKPVATFRAFDGKNPGLEMACYEHSPCGCRVIGNGTLPHPLKVKFCPAHEVAPELLAALKLLAEGCTREMGKMSSGHPYVHVRLAAIEKAREVIAKAEGR